MSAPDAAGARTDPPVGPEEAPGDVLELVDRMIGELSAHPDPTVGERLSALLAGIDAVHRTGLTHLVQAIHGMAGDAFLHRLCSDPAVRLLLMSYDLIAVDRHIQTEEALDVVRGHLHRRGIDVEVTEVVGGVVYVRIHGLERGDVDPDAVRRDLETALREGLLGFQELVVGGREMRGSAFVQLSGPRKPRRPVYRRVADRATLPRDGLSAVELDGLPILVATVGGEAYAVHNRCGDTPLPLQFGELDGHVLRCSWHGCRYDVRTGTRIDGFPGRIEVLPVREADGGVWVAVGTEPLPEAGP